MTKRKFQLVGIGPLFEDACCGARSVWRARIKRSGFCAACKPAGGSQINDLAAKSKGKSSEE